MIYKCNKELQTYTGIYKKKNKLNNKNDNFYLSNAILTFDGFLFYDVIPI